MGTSLVSTYCLLELKKGQKATKPQTNKQCLRELNVLEYAKKFFYFRFPIEPPSISTEIGGMDIDLGDISNMDIDINTIFQIVDQNGPIQFQI